MSFEMLQFYMPSSGKSSVILWGRQVFGRLPAGAAFGAARFGHLEEFFN
jgi:hypothetical protein